MSQEPTHQTGKKPAAKTPDSKAAPARAPASAGPAMGRAAIEPVGAAAADILALQRQVGNRAVARMVASGAAGTAPSRARFKPSSR